MDQIIRESTYRFPREFARKTKHLALQNKIKYTYDHPPTYDDEDGIRLRRTFGIFQKPARIRILNTGSTLFQNFAPEMIASINDGKICAYYG